MKKKKIELTEGKRKVIASLLNEYDIKSVSDIQDKELLGFAEYVELDDHLEKHWRSEGTNARNKEKVIRSSAGELIIQTR